MPVSKANLQSLSFCWPGLCHDEQIGHANDILLILRLSLMVIYSLKHPLTFIFLRASVISMVLDINCYVFDIIGYDMYNQLC